MLLNALFDYSIDYTYLHRLCSKMYAGQVIHSSKLYLHCVMMLTCVICLLAEVYRYAKVHRGQSHALRTTHFIDLYTLYI